MIEHFYQTLLPSLESAHLLLYLAAFSAAFAETALVVGLLVPGSTLLLLLGALSGTGHIDFVGLFAFAVAGAVLGDNLNYWLGKRYGQRWLKTGVWYLKPAQFQQAHQFFNRNGAKSVFLGRFVPGLKEVTPFVAGSAGMRPMIFLFWNVLGSLGWGLEWVGAGYLFGQSLALAQAWLSRIGFLFLGLVLLWLITLYFKYALLRHGPQVWLLLKSLYRSVMAALAANPYIKRFKRHHPRLVDFLHQRLDRNRFSGLPLSLLSLSLCYIMILYGGIIEDILTSDPIVYVDKAAAQLVAHFRPPEVVPVLIWITALGIAKVTAPLVLIAIAVTWLYRGRWLALSLLVSISGTALFTLLSKLVFHRPRPVESILFESTYSFPSGHAAIAVGFYGFLGYVLVRSAPTLRARINRTLLTLILILLIGLSRIVLGVHYLSDVWAGYLVGAGWLVIAITISEWASHNCKIDWQAPLDQRRRLLLWLLSFAAIGWYLFYAAHWQPKTYTPPPVVAESIDKPLASVLKERGLEYTETLLGTPSQPLSVAFVTPDQATLVKRLEPAGWRPADPPTPANFLKLFEEGMHYVNAPLAPVFWNSNINDMGLEREVEAEDENNGKTMIDTLRLWKTPWRTHDATIVVGVVRSYTDRYWGLLHKISPDTDATTQRLRQSLDTTAPRPAVCEVRLTPPKVADYLLGMSFFSSGKLLIVDLRGNAAPELCQSQQEAQ